MIGPLCHCLGERKDGKNKKTIYISSQIIASTKNVIKGHHHLGLWTLPPKKIVFMPLKSISSDCNVYVYYWTQSRVPTLNNAFSKHFHFFHMPIPQHNVQYLYTVCHQCPKMMVSCDQKNSTKKTIYQHVQDT